MSVNVLLKPKNHFLRSVLKRVHQKPIWIPTVIKQYYQASLITQINFGHYAKRCFTIIVDVNRSYGVIDFSGKITVIIRIKIENRILSIAVRKQIIFIPHLNFFYRHLW